MANLKQELADLTKVEGIGAAVIVGRDGFVIEGMSDGGGLDLEAVGAVVSTGIGAAAAMGHELNVGDMDQAMVEYKTGVIVMSYLGRDALLAIVADLQANLGNIRYQIKKRMPEIERAL